MQTRNPFFDDISKFATSAAGVAQGLAEEIRTIVTSQAEKLIANMDLVRRDEFDAQKALLADALARIAALESPSDAAIAKSAPKRAAKPKNID